MTLITSHTQLKSFSTGSADVTSICFNNAGLLAVSTSDRKIRIFNSETIEELPCSPLKPQVHSYAIGCICFNPHQPYLATCAIDGLLVVWDLLDITEPKIQCQFSVGQLKTCCFSKSADHSLVAAGDTEGVVYVWNFMKQILVRSYKGHSGQITGMSFSPDGLWLLSGSSGMGNGDLWIWPVFHPALTELSPQHALDVNSSAHEMGLYCLDFSPAFRNPSGDMLLATGGGDNFIKLWTISINAKLNQRIKLRATLEFHTFNITDCKFSPDGTFLCSAALDQTVAIWDPKTSDLLYVMREHIRFVATCSWATDNRTLATGGNCKSLMVWKIITPTTENHHSSTSNITLDKSSKPNVDYTRTISLEETFPNEFYCPISQEVMTDPVVASDGYSYERSSIHTWIVKSNTSPITNLPLPSLQFIPNRTLKSLINSKYQPSKA